VLENTLDDMIEYKPEHFVDGSGVVRSLEPGLALRAKDVATLMIIVSDNVATNMMIDFLGQDDINECIQRLGCKDTVLHNPIDFVKYRQLGTSTVADYASIFIRSLKGELIGPEEDAQMLEIFKKQHYNSMLTKQFPVALFDAEDCGAEEGAFWTASKSGSMDACRNDGGIIHTPYGEYVLVMFNKEFSDAMYYPEHPATVFGSKVSKLLFDQYLALEGRFVL
jgi:beta-lactamase class A